MTAMAAILLALGAAAQQCNYYFLQNNKTVEMTIYNRKGDPNGKQIYTVSEVKNGGGGATSSQIGRAHV